MTYTLCLTPANPEFSGSLRTYAANIYAATEHFNGGRMRNPKTLRVLDIQDRFLILELKSEIDLPTPAKALRLFTQYLLKFSDINRCVYHNSLFRNVSLPTQAPAGPAAQTDEVEVMATLTRLLMGELPHRKEVFATVQVLLSRYLEMDRPHQQAFLSRLPALIEREAEQTKTACGTGERGH